ncbi:uracil-DNA glycosylase [Undibacterium sp. SXout20W]
MNVGLDFLPAEIRYGLQCVHPSWLDAVVAGLVAMQRQEPDYFEQLVLSEFYPTKGRLFAAFELPIDMVRYVLVGEGPYPREESATGVCFMDGAVTSLWSSDGSGLSKPVNRATSLRNFIKMLLVASGDLDKDATSGAAMAEIARKAIHPEFGFIQTLPELQKNLSSQGILLLNASLVFRTTVAPVKDGKSWQPFFRSICASLYKFHSVSPGSMPSLILWGKIAESLKNISELAVLPQILAEHPYNLTFIKNPSMHELFRPMRLLNSCQKEKFC